MKLSIPRNSLTRIASLAASAIASKALTPIQGTILLDARADTLLARGTDLARTVSATAAAKVSRPGTFAVARGDLLGAANAMPSGDVALEVVDGKKLVLSSGKRKLTVPCLDGAEFPRVPVVDEKADGVTVSPATLADVVGRVAYARSPDDTRPMMFGTWLEFPDGIVRAVATDGHRLGMCERPREGSEIESFMLLYSASDVVLAACDGDGADDVTIRRAGTLASFTRGDIEIVVQLGGAFPSWNYAMPPKGDVVPLAIVSRKELLDSIKATSSVAVAEKGERVLCLIYEPGRISIVSADKRDARGADEVGCKYEGPRIAHYVNGGYLMDALGAVEGEDVSIRVAEPLDQPIIVRAHGEGSGGSLHLTMRRRAEWAPEVAGG